jgi:hypothetical protein
MTLTPACPQCGETERLTGTAQGDVIEIRCEACGAAWLRESARCRGCGGEESLSRPQLMTRHPRGTLLSIVGRRRLVLCPRCDAAVLGSEEDAASDAPVPEGYVSRFLAGLPVERPARPPAPRRKPRPRAPTTGLHVPTSSASSEAAVPERPTVRQAIEHFLTVHPGSDSLAMLLLGQHLGPSTRLHLLDEKSAREMATWVASTWPDGGPVSTVRAVAAYWREQGWTPVDLAEHLD